MGCLVQIWLNYRAPLGIHHQLPNISMFLSSGGVVIGTLMRSLTLLNVLV